MMINYNLELTLGDEVVERQEDVWALTAMEAIDRFWEKLLEPFPVWCPKTEKWIDCPPQYRAKAIRQ